MRTIERFRDFIKAHGNFVPLGPDMVLLNEEYARAGAPEVPHNAKQVIDMATDVQRKIDRPFISVDCFTTGDRVILGELTPGPGGLILTVSSGSRRP